MSFEHRSFFAKGSFLLRVSLPVVLIMLIVFVSLSAVDTWGSGLGWHDHQRVHQLFFLSAAVALSLIATPRKLPWQAFGLLAAILLIGLVSAVFSEFAFWALKEWARYVALVILGLMLSLAANKVWVVAAALGVMSSIGSYQAFQFMSYYASAFFSEVYILDAGLLTSGFSNPRFFGQFQVILLPVMASMVMMTRPSRPALCLFLFAALSIQWCIALTLGGRGLWLGLAASSLVLVFFASQHWRLLVVQAGAGVVGAIIFFVMFYLIPDWLELPLHLHDNLRAGFSERERIWGWAIEMALANPLLGVGPMHFSATFNPVAAHPHQMILQWAAEWGIPATLMLLALTIWGMIFGLRHVRGAQSDSVGAALWLAIAGALVLAQVDGVFVMPYTETWLAILSGLALSKWTRPQTAPREQRIFILALAAPVLIILGDVLLNEAGTLSRDTEIHLAKHGVGLAPRFWLQGWIPMDGTLDAE